MKKNFTILIVLLFLVFPMNVFAEEACSHWASQGKSVCITKSYQGYKCTWNGNKKGGARCYKSDKKTASGMSSGGSNSSADSSTSVTSPGYTSCTQITDSQRCQSSKVKGNECIWRQGACFNAVNDGTNDTVIADDQNDRENQDKKNENDNYEKRIYNFLINADASLSRCGTGDGECVNQQAKFYEEVENLANWCKKVYSDMTIKKSDSKYKSCEALNNGIAVKQELISWCKERAKEVGDSGEDCEKSKTSIEYYAQEGYFGNRVINSELADGCTETLGSLGIWLSRIYNALLLIVPIIIVAFGFKDFIQALGAGKEDELKKVGSTFIKRLIFGAVFVVLPMLIKFILTIALGGDVANMCIF